jgi:preprotein translocase subunit SecF
MNIVKNRKIFFFISGALVVFSLLAIFVWGLNLGIDFKGGSLIELSFINERPEINMLNIAVNESEFGEVLIQNTGDKGIIVRTEEITAEERNNLKEILSIGGTYTLVEERFTAIGPVLGDELKKKAFLALILTSISIIIFVAFAFRHVSKPISSWKYGLVAILALAHDIIIPTGFVAILGKFAHVEADALFVTALLAILGLSVNDTIVVFDRIRENLKKGVSKHFEESVSISLSQTITRSINTSVTTLFVLFALYIFGPDSTRVFTLILSIGLIVGTYSSIFLASPLLVQLQPKRK